MSENLQKELEKQYLQIAKMIGLDREFLTFEFTKDGDVNHFRVITINPRHKQSFVFHTTQGFGEIDAVSKMIDYIKEHHDVKNTYTIQWAIDKSSELNTSYFRGKNVYEVLDKFYYGKDITGTIIFNISLNPLS